MTALTLTIDLEDPSGEYHPKGRYVDMTERVLDLCTRTGTKATFFTVGKLAKAAPGLIMRIASQGHEIAYHAHAHLPLTAETPDRFKQQTRDDRTLLEQLTGAPLSGFRAPGFSLTPQTLWATEILKELGFLYSSSIMPTSVSRFGFPDAPTTPFTWPSGLLELPLPMATLGKLRLPYSGGIYLYCWPSFITDAFLKRVDPHEVIWTYAHPHDFDIDERFKPMQDTPKWMSLILWYMRAFADKKMRHILAKHQHAAPLGEIAKHLLTETALPALPLK